jgi:hypothetical protein
VDAPRGGEVLLNATFDKQWRADVGAPGDYNAALKITVPPGHHALHVRYRPRLFDRGLALSSVTALGVIAFFVVERRRLRRV